MTIQTSGRNQWTVPSQTQPDTLYIVRRHDGLLTCDCPAGFYRGRCKHITAVAATLPRPSAKGPSARDTGLLFMAPRHRNG